MAAGPYGEVTPALLQELLLSHLLQAQSSGNWQLCSSAREHLLCGTLYNGIGELQQREASADEQLQLLGSCRELAAQREAVKAELVSLDSGAGCLLNVHVVGRLSMAVSRQADLDHEISHRRKGLCALHSLQ